DRTETATPRRREEARERGQVARSNDLNGALVLLAALVALNFFGKAFLEGLTVVSRGCFGGLATLDLTTGNLPHQFGGLLWFLFRTLAPLLIAVVAVALASNWAQVGFFITTDPLAPQASRLNPIAGLRRMFSARSAARLAQDFVKLAFLGAVLATTLSSNLPLLLSLSDHTVPRIAAALADLGFTLSIRAALSFVALGILDYLFQRWQFERELRMSKQEIREEMKRLEGNPRVRERRRAIQRQVAMQRMMAAVPKAAVIITNPTHFAVALAYDEKMAAPRIVAKGADLIAERIREVALENGIPIVERPPLARELFKCEVGKEVPPKMFEAVAEILAYVYSLKKGAA
ncbi:MAG: flagellar biosynthesis protein FlhB, partial [Planctomycetes bacterium]|nr:flagellar biosynthesis protein FlhB [Planctomycetota bacterium]